MGSNSVEKTYKEFFMTIRTIALLAAASMLVACSAATETAQTKTAEAAKTVAKVTTQVAGEVEKRG